MINTSKAIIILIALFLSPSGMVYADVAGILPGKIRLYFYESGTASEQVGNNDIHAALRDTISVDVYLYNSTNEPVTGVEFFLTVDDRYFDIVSNGKNKDGSLMPFVKGEYMRPALDPTPVERVGNTTHSDSLTAADNGINGWQLDYIQISPPSYGGGERPVSTLRYGVACTFRLVAKAPCDSIEIKVDNDQFYVRETRYHLRDNINDFYFKIPQKTYISVLGIEINPPLPDIFMAPGTADSTLDLDDHVELAKIPDSLLIWTASGNNKIGVAIDSLTHGVTFTAPGNFKGYEDITFAVKSSDGRTTAQDTMRVLVDYSPKLRTDVIPKKITIREDSLEYVMKLQDAVQDSDDTYDNLRWFISTGTNLTYSVAADSLLWLKGEKDYNGTDLLNLSVYDSLGLGDSLTVPVQVLPVNDPPKLSGLPDITFVRGEFYKLNIANYASDVDGDQLTLSWKPPENLFLNVNGLLVTLTSDIFIGKGVIIFTVTDPYGLAASDTLSVTVKPAAKPPVWSHIPKIGFAQGHADSTLIIWDYVSDPDDSDNNLSFIFTGRDDIDSIFVNGTTGRMTMYDLNNTPGWDRIMVTAFDPDGNSASTQFLAFIGPIDGTPIVGGIPDTTMVAGTEAEWIDLDDFYYDVDNTDTQMRWTWGRQAAADSVIAVSIHPLSHRVTLRSLGTDKYGLDRIFFTVIDPSEKFANDICIITVVKDLSKPMLALPFKVGFPPGEKTTLDLDDYVEDLLYDKSDLSWSWSQNQKTIITLNNPDAINSRPVTFSGPSDWVGWEYVSFKVTNPLGGAAQDTVLVFSVSQDGSPLAGGLRPFSLKAGECATVNLDNYYYDADSPSSDMTWSVSGNDSITVKINLTTHIATVCAPSESWEGQENITFTVTDKQNHSSSMAVLVTVTDAIIHNVFSLIIFRNPMQEDYMDFYITGKEEVTGLPTVRVKIGQDSTSVSVETITSNYYYGKYLLPIEKSLGTKGTANILVSATTKAGNKAVQDTTRFAYGRVDAGGAKIVLGPVALTVPAGALAKPALITVAPGAESTDRDSNRSDGEVMFSGVPYTIGPSALAAGKPLMIEFSVPRKTVGPGIYERNGDRWHFLGTQRVDETVGAGIYGGGTFRLGYDATPPQLTLIDSDDKATRIGAVDYGSGIDGESITVLLDGKETSFSYEPEQSVITINRENISGNGLMYLEITVSDRSGNRKVERFAAEGHAQPDIISLEQNHPNPFNPVTHITFENTTEQLISLEVYDLLGRKVRCIAQDRLPAGRHTFTWDARDDSGRMVSSGTYLYRVISNTRTITKKMLLLR